MITHALSSEIWMYTPHIMYSLMILTKFSEAVTILKTKFIFNIQTRVHTFFLLTIDFGH